MPAPRLPRALTDLLDDLATDATTVLGRALPRRPELRGKVVLVTGASSGIGRATAQRAALEGAHVVLVARDRASLQLVADECDGAASTTVLPADVGDDEAVRRVVETVLDRHGRLDVVVSNAGVVAYGRFESVPPEVFEGVLRTNLLGSANVARHVLPVLRRQRAGDLVLVGSVIGHLAVPQMSAYATSKWGVRGLARQLQVENRDLAHVHVHYVAPGGVDTPIYQQAATSSGHLGSPPPPVATPERTARQVLDRVGNPHVRSQLAWSNEAIRFGAAYLPGVYGVLVGPLFRLLATDRDHLVPPGPGNVLESKPTGNALRGRPRGPLGGTLSGTLGGTLGGGLRHLSSALRGGR
ncbi:SDR family NAD(P)-dependent oxidoreductase [Nocardioides perillae]|uniref:NAD(P)-dependent dehydrogenase (Short-subunit alcohol dehydrogenase family) n=1 Tax=Nocardioides perillae TaxID=1119534 RepID=A0A7Y9RV08_9ACTN|nr:NAD(P)-dependent dehydrogenase (short-subunit alcohol dehydrogenase family) [Nocardioides perillae]